MSPFSRIAPYYDTLMNHIDYPGWIEYIKKFFQVFHKQPKVIIDVACGTGNASLLLAQSGFKVIGVDRSAAMLEIFKEKSRGLDIDFVCADMRGFEVPQPGDAAISLFDSINYLLTEEELERCFCNVHRNLKPGGLFIFDMNTIFGLSTHWGNSITLREVGAIYSVWKNSYDYKENISTLHLTLFVKNQDHYERLEELHRERGYPTAVVEKRLKRAGFIRCHFYQHLFFTPPASHTARFMVVAEG
jgi:ubiquinone/menaquinone biosynthesis C-methylase UbiE